MNDPKKAKQVQARKAWSFFGVLASMGQFAAAAATAVTPRRRKFLGRLASEALQATLGERPTEAAGLPAAPRHVAAVALMREARRLKAMAKAEDALSEKRRRQAGQLQRRAPERSPAEPRPCHSAHPMPLSLRPFSLRRP